MVVGRCITLVGCIMYIFVEFIPSGRRWWMLVCYMLFGVGFGTSPLLRSYVVRVTSDENRASAFAMLNGAGVLSVMVGPIAQLAFADLPYPGIDIIPPNIKLNIYSAPIWVAVITNIVAILISVFLLQDAPAVEEKQSDKSFSFSLAAIRELYSKLRGLNIPWILVALIFVEKMVSGLFNATMPSVVGPLMTSMYAFDGQEIIIILGVSQVLVGLLAVAFTVGFVLLKLGNRVSCRVLFAFSNIMMITGYVITYPYPFDSMPMQPFNETSRIGCDREEYAWCDTQLVVNIVPFIIVMIIVSAFAIPSAMMSLDTIYSKIIGNIDQNMMQSFIVIADDAISIIGPIYGSAIFTAMGLNFLSIFNGCIYIIGTILWFSAWRWLKPHWDDKKHYWSRRGITGPEAQFGLGNLNDLQDHYRPKSLVIKNWTKQYGKVYGFHEGHRKILVISDLEMMNELLVKKFDHFTARVPFPMNEGEEDGPKTQLVQARGGHWKKLRAIASYAFTNKALRHIQRTVEDSTLQMIEEMKKHKGEVNTLEFYQELTLDVISKIALGQKDAKIFKNPHIETCRQIFSLPQPNFLSTIPLTMPLMKKPLTFVLGKLASASEHPYIRLLKEVEQTVALRKKAREAGSLSSGDFIDIFLDAEVDLVENQLTDTFESKGSRKLVFDEIVSLCIVMLLAGFETTANSLSYLTHFLANYPEVQDRIFEEVEDVCPGDTIEYEQLAELRYTDAVIKESLRHYPLASFVVSRECEKSTSLGGIPIEKGEYLLTDTWSMHMDKEIWGEDAEEFRPERWLEESSRARVAFQSFGEGPRMCIGMRLAYMEEKTAIAHVLKNFRIKKAASTNPIKLVGCLTVAPERLDREILVGTTMGSVIDTVFNDRKVTAAFIGLQSIPFTLLCIHFLYRYWSVCRPHLIKLFSNNLVHNLHDVPDVGKCHCVV
ncbi:hypothetical protein PRIPAC_79111 [Pristionchus pacificus]|nr:hypothetical protein PRIPAC_79111 [Pristionchus pacificus]